MSNILYALQFFIIIFCFFIAFIGVRIRYCNVTALKSLSFMFNKYLLIIIIITITINKITIIIIITVNKIMINK